MSAEQTISVRSIKEYRSPDFDQSIDILKAIYNISIEGLNQAATKLGDLVNGCDANDQPNDIVREFPKISIKPFVDISADDNTESGKFMSTLFGEYIKKTKGNNEIRLIGVGSYRQTTDDVFSGLVMLCDENKKDGNFICIQYIVNDEANRDTTRISMRGIRFLNYKKRFKRMPLSQQALVVQKLFLATQKAITEALDAY